MLCGISCILPIAVSFRLSACRRAQTPTVADGQARKLRGESRLRKEKGNGKGCAGLLVTGGSRQWKRHRTQFPSHKDEGGPPVQSIERKNLIDLAACLINFCAPTRQVHGLVSEHRLGSP
uniref:Uncharacterized protein n=1 Tax=Chromera velia CCMP2878 TaxID=1169474 RepID=A0A0G4FAG6_9ALVE|eukprot:Cvel_200.t1-p1 / transcript=Cvel_200.t1 / gene=Cvel_200 / organism=Chromera_velia_CCMP2878 / gene_product=hypothetical protein / transcript_product=hypothetical protein / location=Cvel_scaffold11:239244-240866(+) / protein_length=119 / sequence_SO=supercontig / SO=protein_coding / is_pseudo=false